MVVPQQEQERHQAAFLDWMTPAHVVQRDEPCDYVHVFCEGQEAGLQLPW